MKTLPMLTSAALLFVLGLVSGLTWSTTSSVSRQVMSQPLQEQQLADRADMVQSRRMPRWVF